MKNGTTNHTQPLTCSYYVARAQLALEPHLTTANSDFALPFLRGIDVMVLADRINSASDPALASIIEIASRGTGIPKEAVKAYAEMAVAMNQPVQIYGSEK